MESSEFTAWCFSRIHPSANPQALISFPISDRNGQRGRRVPPTVSTYACRMGETVCLRVAMALADDTHVRCCAGGPGKCGAQRAGGFRTRITGDVTPPSRSAPSASPACPYSSPRPRKR